MRHTLITAVFLTLAFANPNPKPAARPGESGPVATAGAKNGPWGGGAPGGFGGGFFGHPGGPPAAPAGSPAPSEGQHGGQSSGGNVVNSGSTCPNGNCNGCLSTNGQYYCPLSDYGGQCPNGNNCNGCIQQNGQTYCPNNNNNNLNNGGCPNGNCNGCISQNGQEYCPLSNYGGQCPNNNCAICIQNNGQTYCPNLNNGINGINGGCPNGNCNGCTYQNGQQYCPLSNYNGQCPSGNCNNCIQQNGQTYCPNNFNNGFNNFFATTSLLVDPTGTYTFGFNPTSTSHSCGRTTNGISTYSVCLSYFYGSNGAASTITGYTGRRTTFTYLATSGVTAWTYATNCGNFGNGINSCTTYSYPTSVSYRTYSVVQRAAATRLAEPMPIARGVIAQGLLGAAGLVAAALL